jgi:hypothetical protein
MDINQLAAMVMALSQQINNLSKGIQPISSNMAVAVPVNLLPSFTETQNSVEMKGSIIQDSPKTPKSDPPSPTQMNLGMVANQNNYFVSQLDEKTPTRNTSSSQGITAQQNQRTPSSTVNSTVNNTTEKHKVPIEFSHTLPSKIQLEIKANESEDFLKWKGSVISSVEKIPKFTGFLSTPLVKSWEYFKTRNQSNFSLENLQNSYIDCHQEIYGFIMECLEGNFAMQIQRTFSLGEYDLCRELGFSVSHPSSHKNAFALMQYLESYHVQSSRWRVTKILNSLCNLVYTGKEDPRLFISQFHDLLHRGQLLGGDKDWWPTFSDASLANMMISKLVGSATEVPRQNIQLMDKQDRISLRDVEDILLQWWLSRETSKTLPERSAFQPGSHNPQGNSLQNKGKPPSTPFKKQNSSEGQGQSGSTHAAVNHSSSPNGNNKKKEIKRKPNEGESEFTSEGHSDGEFGAAAIVESSDEGQHEVANHSMREVYSNNYIPQRHEILWDTGATVSLTPCKERIEDISKVPPIKIGTMNGPVTSDHVGTVRFKNQIRIDNIHVLPNAPYSLFSLSKATEKGAVVVFTKDTAYLLPPNSRNEQIVKVCEDHSIFSGEKKGKLWVSQLYKPSDEHDEQFIREKHRQTTLPTMPARRIPKIGETPVKSPAVRKVSFSEVKSQSTNQSFPVANKASNQLTTTKSLSPMGKDKSYAAAVGTANSFAALENETDDTPSSSDESSGEF